MYDVKQYRYGCVTDGSGNIYRVTDACVNAANNLLIYVILGWFCFFGVQNKFYTYVNGQR